MNGRTDWIAVELLENRQLFAAAAAPNLLGAFVGRANNASGAVLVQFTIQSQKKLAASGSVLAGDGSQGHLTGNINRKNQFHFTEKGGTFTTKWTGQLTGDTLAGTYLTTAPHRPRQAGTFSVTRIDTSNIESGPVLDAATGHFYYVLKSSDWADAQSEAQAIGGHLVTIADSGEQSFVANNFATPGGGVGRNIWIGYDDPTQDTLTGAAHAANFVWVDGSTSTTTFWNSGEPNNFNHTQFYAYMMAPHWDTNEAWDDADGTSVVDHFGAPYQGVAEIEP